MNAYMYIFTCIHFECKPRYSYRFLYNHPYMLYIFCISITSSSICLSVSLSHIHSPLMCIEFMYIGKYTHTCTFCMSVFRYVYIRLFTLILVLQFIYPSLFLSCLCLPLLPSANLSLSPLSLSHFLLLNACVYPCMHVCVYVYPSQIIERQEQSLIPPGIGNPSAIVPEPLASRVALAPGSMALSLSPG